MKEIKDIVKAYDEAVRLGKHSALATVVLVEGSAYRRAGARMLITEDGNLTGAISGGCLEGDALRKARLAMAQQQPMLVTYDTTDDDDAKLGVGLGCNGIIHILIEPIDSENKNNPLQLLKAATVKRQKTVLVTLFSIQNRKEAQPGTCLVFSDGQPIFNNVDDEVLKNALIDDAAGVLRSGISKTKTYFSGNELTGFVELILPVIAVMIIGAGNDAIPLMQMAYILGWDTTIIDGRANYARADRFPFARQVIVARPEQVLQQIDLDDRSVMVLMTHNYNYEIALLKVLLPLDLNYVGMLGPKKKLDRMLAELKDEGLQIDPAQLQKIYGPIGLDIGAESSEEIALAIVAEIKAVLARRKGYSLKDKAASIHSPEPQLVRL